DTDARYSGGPAASVQRSQREGVVDVDRPDAVSCVSPAGSCSIRSTEAAQAPRARTLGSTNRLCTVSTKADQPVPVQRATAAGARTGSRLYSSTRTLRTTSRSASPG